MNGILYFPCLEPNSRISIFFFFVLIKGSVRPFGFSSKFYTVLCCAVRCTYDRMIGRKTSLRHQTERRRVIILVLGRHSKVNCSSEIDVELFKTTKFEFEIFNASPVQLINTFGLTFAVRSSIAYF